MPYSRARSRALNDRIHRALSQDLLLLHRADTAFFILGSTNNVYKVTLSTTPSCSCPDLVNPCKHILFVLIRLLRVSPRDPLLRRGDTLKPSEVSRLLSLPMSDGAVAGDRLRYGFYQNFYRQRQRRLAPRSAEADGMGERSCPVCLDDLEKGDKVVSCGTCGNPVHETCFANWKKSQRGRIRSVTCVFCRAVWPEDPLQGEYLNLSAYVDEEEEEDDDYSGDDEDGDDEEDNDDDDGDYEDDGDAEDDYEDGDGDDDVESIGSWTPN
ncbi:hypothetical protein Dimus_019288 [Dionaea muscipula]